MSIPDSGRSQLNVDGISECLRRVGTILDQIAAVAGDGEADAKRLPLPSQDDIGGLVQAFEAINSHLLAELAEKRQLITRLEEAQNQLLQSEKMASIGQLAAGVAHEINNPVGFVNSNLGTLERYVQDLLRLLDAYNGLENSAAPPPWPAIAALKAEMEFDFLRDDVADLLRESKDGLDRVKRIVQDLKDFSRVDSSPTWQWTDLNRCLDSTLNVAANEIKHKADVVKAYGALPAVEGLPSQLNQVFLNLMVNAAHAIDPARRGTITLSSGQAEDWVWVAVADTGSGIAPEHMKRIFEPFFTTKPAGKGTGLGLSVSYNIVAKHGGRIEVDSLPGQGTTFRVWLPVSHAEAPGAGT